MHTPRYRRVLGWALALLGLTACASSLQLPYLARPDTRYIIGIEIDSVILRRIGETLQAAFPNEGGVCLPVVLRDTTVNGHVKPYYVATVTGTAPAAVAHASPFVVYDTTVFFNGCPSTRQFARGHSHPYAIAPRPCTHSHQDAFLLASDQRLLFTIVFCGDGRAEVLYQDARRDAVIWFERADAPEPQ